MCDELNFICDKDVVLFIRSQGLETIWQEEKLTFLTSLFGELEEVDDRALFDRFSIVFFFRILFLFTMTIGETVFST